MYHSHSTVHSSILNIPWRYNLPRMQLGRVSQNRFSCPRKQVKSQNLYLELVSTFQVYLKPQCTEFCLKWINKPIAVTSILPLYSQPSKYSCQGQPKRMDMCATLENTLYYSWSLLLTLSDIINMSHLVFCWAEDCSSCWEDVEGISLDNPLRFKLGIPFLFFSWEWSTTEIQ